MKEKIHIKKALSLMLILAVGLVLGFAAGTDTASAASKPAKVTLTSAYASGQHAAVLKWKKTKGAKGYQIYRNGQLVKRVAGAKTLSCTDTGLAAGTGYTYKVNAYKTKKTKEYYNKKTGKWQKKQPKKKYRGGTRTVTKCIGGKMSASKSVRTAGAARASQSTYSNPSTPGTSNTTNTPTSPNAPSSGVQIINGSLTVSSYPKTMTKGETKYATFNKPCPGTLSFRSSNSNTVTVTAYGDNQAKLTAKAEGTVNITATFTPSSGYTVTGNKTSMVYVTVARSGGIQTRGGVVYPSADGTFTVTQGSTGSYTHPVCINGVNNPISELAKLPSGSTIRINANNMRRTSIFTTNGQTLYESPQSWGTMITSSSNPNVVYISKSYRTSGIYPTILNGEYGTFFVGPGTSSVTLSNGNKITVIVTGQDSELLSYINFRKTWSNQTAGMSDLDKVKYAIAYVKSSYYYGSYASFDAYGMFITKNGDCWAGNSMLYILCEEMGIPIEMRNASQDMYAGSGHKNCIVTINGSKYIADATPTKCDSINSNPYSSPETFIAEMNRYGWGRTFMLYDTYMSQYGN